MTPQEQAALLRELGLTERDMERVRVMVDEAAVKVDQPGPVITALIDLDAEARVFWVQPGRTGPWDATYVGSRKGWKIYAAKLTNSDRLERGRMLGRRP